MKKPTQRQANRLAKKLLKQPPAIARVVERLQKRIDLIAGLPMKDVLARLPVQKRTEQAKLLGCARQSLYDWVNERSRPNLQQAEKLAKLTGLSVKDIRARE